ncbi:MAG: hypothetical protein JSW33_11945 [bacterium]|nr:MAG: hypothetical protein JSW33_11945 [bacterium]
MISIFLPPISIFIIMVILPALSPEIYWKEKTLHDSEKKITISKLSDTDRELAEKIISLAKEQAYLTTRLQCAKDDSISVSLNLADSSLNIDIHGLTVRECVIKEVSLNRGYRHLKDQDILISWISSVFQLEHELATLPKAPIVVKNAPKDTLEARDFFQEPGKREIEDTYITLYFSKGLIIELEQVEPLKISSYLSKLNYTIRKSLTRSFLALQDLLEFKIPEYPIRIKLKLTRNDIQAVYRALPKKAKLALFI